MSVFFTSDWHLDHQNIIKYCDRPFSSAKEMNEAIIQKHNALVKPNDLVYNLGDVFMKSSDKYAEHLLSRFNGRIYIIIGSHDNRRQLLNLKNAGVIEGFYDTKEIKIDGKYIWLSHYPHRSWARSFHGSFHLFGHCHGRMPPYGKSFDVGVDCWDFAPVSFEQVCEKMQNLNQSND